MKEVFKRYSVIWALFLAFLLIGGVLLIFTTKGEILRWVNIHHNSSLHFFFRYMTWFGGQLIPVIIGVSIFIRFKYFIVLAASNIITFVVTQFFKRLVFDIPRPKLFFKELGEALNVVEGVALHSNFSFPSGHSSSAFSLFMGIAFLSKNRWVSIFCFISAVIVAMSRVYLTQHFFADIYAGAILGIVITFLVYYYLSTRKWYEYDWAHKPFLIGWDWKRR